MKNACEAQVYLALCPNIKHASQQTCEQFREFKNSDRSAASYLNQQLLFDIAFGHTDDEIIFANICITILKSFETIISLIIKHNLNQTDICHFYSVGAHAKFFLKIKSLTHRL